MTTADQHQRSAPLPPNASLEETRRWLDVQCDIEQSKVDWTNDFDGEPRDLAEPGLFSQGPDTAVLDRIRRGHGPCSVKYEDLLWSVRSEGSNESSRFSKHRRNESYNAMKQVLLDWNKHVATPYHDPEARKALIDAMYERVEFLDLLLPQRRSANAYDPTSTKLLHAIHAYRPETAAFTTTDTTQLLTIIIAHIGYTIPDIDEELKFLIFYTLVTERVHAAHEANAADRRQAEYKIMKAKQQGDAELIAKYEQDMKNWQHDIFEKNCGIIADKIKFARRNVEANVLEDLQTLTVMQTAQKMVLNDKLSGNRSMPALLVQSESNATALATAVDAQLPPLLASTLLASQNYHGMEYTARKRITSRAKKFTGLDRGDKSETERHRLVEERMANPDTVRMMKDAMDGVAETKESVNEMMIALDAMEEDMEELHRKAQELVEGYETLDKLIEPEPLADVDGDVDEVDVDQPW